MSEGSETSSPASQIPDAIAGDIARSKRLEIWTLLWIGSIVVVMGLVMGSSQAMKSAWVEDVLSLVPAIVFLVALVIGKGKPDAKFRYGYRSLTTDGILISPLTLNDAEGIVAL